MLFVRLDEKVIKKKIEMVTSSTVRRTIIITVKGTVQLKSLSHTVNHYQNNLYLEKFLANLQP